MSDIKQIEKVIYEGLDGISDQFNQKFDQKFYKLEEKVNSHIAANGKLGGGYGFSSPDYSNSKALMADAWDLVRQNYSDIKSEKQFVSTKSVGTMTLGNNLSGTSVVSYTQNPVMRSYFNPHLYDLFRIVPTDTGNVTFPRGSNPVGEGSFGTQTEGQVKAQVDYDLNMINVSVPFIAGYAKVSRQMLQDLPFLQGYLSSSLIEDWNRAVDNKFVATITASATSGSTSATVVAERIVDYVAQLNSLGLGQADMILTTHAVWASIMKTLPANGSYSVPGGVTIGADGSTRIAGIPLVAHNGIPTGRIYVLNRSAFGIAQASGLTVRSAETDQDDFIKNLVTYRCEARVELLSFQPTAAIYGSAS